MSKKIVNEITEILVDVVHLEKQRKKKKQMENRQMMCESEMGNPRHQQPQYLQQHQYHPIGNTIGRNPRNMADHNRRYLPNKSNRTPQQFEHHTYQLQPIYSTTEPVSKLQQTSQFYHQHQQQYEQEYQAEYCQSNYSTAGPPLKNKNKQKKKGADVHAEGEVNAKRVGGTATLGMLGGASKMIGSQAWNKHGTKVTNFVKGILQE